MIFNSKNNTSKIRSANVIALALLMLSFSAFCEQKNKIETINEVSIIGNTELPNKNFDLEWRLPSVEKRENQSPPKFIKGMLLPVEPHRYRQQIHFSHYLNLGSSNFSAR